MPEVIFQAGNRIIWNQEKLLLKIRSKARRKLEKMGDMLVAALQANTSGSSPSSPGDYPGKKTGSLSNSFFWTTKYEGTGVSLSVSFKARHGWVLEFGGNRFYSITPKTAKVLVFRGRSGEKVFSKRVWHPPMSSRPFLVKTLKNMWPVLDEMWRQGVL